MTAISMLITTLTTVAGWIVSVTQTTSAGPKVTLQAGIRVAQSATHMADKVECWNLFYFCLYLSAPSSHMYFIAVNVSSFWEVHPIASLTLPTVQRIRQNWHIAFSKISLELNMIDSFTFKISHPPLPSLLHLGRHFGRVSQFWTGILKALTSSFMQSLKHLFGPCWGHFPVSRSP